jgi:hypothetical protein
MTRSSPEDDEILPEDDEIPGDDDDILAGVLDTQK